MSNFCIITTSNAAIANSIIAYPDGLSLSNQTNLLDGMNISNGIVNIPGNVVTSNTSQINVGTSSINSSKIFVPSLIVEGVSMIDFGGVVNTQIFTANGTWTNPNNALGLTGNEHVFFMMWGGGGGGGTSCAGGGGACLIGSIPLSSLGTTQSIIVGQGGVTQANGANSTFSNYTAIGGAPGTSGGVSGGGAGLLTRNIASAAGGEPLGGAAGSPGNDATFGGGGGGTGAPAIGGKSIFGGGGGGDGTGAGGNTIFGGSGGGTTFGTSSIALTVGRGGAAGGAGSNGEVRIWVVQ